MQGFLKVTMTLEEDDEIQEEAGDAKSRIAKWARGFKNSGVKKIFVVAIVPNLTENYENMARILEVLKIDHIKYNIASDLKLINILLGLQNHKVIY